MLVFCILLIPTSKINADKLEDKKAELRELENKISEAQKDVSSKQSQNFTLQNYISQLESEIEKLRLEMEKSQKELSITETEIEQKQKSLDELNSEMSRKKIALKSYIQHISRQSSHSAFELMLSTSKLSKFFRLFNYARSIERKVYESTMELKEVRDKMNQEKEGLENKMNQQKITSSTLFEQQKQADLKKQESEILHGRNESEIKNLEDVMSSTTDLTTQLRNQIFQLESNGKSVKFTDAVDAARFAEKATGVEAPLLLGIMSQESGLGRNVGQCVYEGNMNPEQYGVFFDIMDDLKKDPKSVRVSCKPQTYSGWGGAMGPGQFIPSTWAAYKPQVESITHRSADPWEITDAMIAIGLYVKAHGGSTMENASTRGAVGQFFAGSNWQNYPWYVDQVYSKAQIFKEQMGRL